MDRPTSAFSTKRLALGQILFCQGCCCGRTDRGKPELPVERLKSVWREEGLNRTIQLTISGCLGPCDLTNVALVLDPERGPRWFGRMEGSALYESIVAWAQACHRAGTWLPLPESLQDLEFDRFRQA